MRHSFASAIATTTSSSTSSSISVTPLAISTATSTVSALGWWIASVVPTCSIYIKCREMQRRVLGGFVDRYF